MTVRLQTKLPRVWKPAILPLGFRLQKKVVLPTFDGSRQVATKRYFLTR